MVIPPNRPPEKTDNHEELWQYRFLQHQGQLEDEAQVTSTNPPPRFCELGNFALPNNALLGLTAQDALEFAMRDHMATRNNVGDSDREDHVIRSHVKTSLLDDTKDKHPPRQ